MPTIHPWRRIAALTAGGAALLFGGGCNAQPTPQPPTTPTPSPKPSARPAPAIRLVVPTFPAQPAPLRSVLDWSEAPITAGEWRWTAEGGQSVARFAGGLLTLRCDPARKTVTLQRQGQRQGQGARLTVVTSAMTRPLAGAGAAGNIAATLPAGDALLDALAFSRGRFALEAAGLPTLYVPSWPEVGRVVEDCR